MNYVIYGVGKLFCNNVSYIFDNLKNDNIVAYIDKSYKEKKNFKYGIVQSPEEILKIKYDRVLVVSIYYEEIFYELITLGVKKDKILSYLDIQIKKSYGDKREYIVANNYIRKKYVAIASSCLGYHGSTVATINLADALISQGFYVDIISSKNSDQNIITEINNKGINVITITSFPYICEKDLHYVDRYDAVVVNTFPAIMVAFQCSFVKPVIFWLHESEDTKYYHTYRSTYPHCFEIIDQYKWMEKIRVLAVSDIAKKPFNRVFDGINVDIVPLGIADNYIEAKQDDISVFAIIGGIYRLKRQKEFVAAAKTIIKEYDNCEFWIIGENVYDKDYAEELILSIKNEKRIRYLGKKNRKEMLELYKDIDVVVCASEIESFSLTMLEGLMLGKICITSKDTGIAQYIKDGENGFVLERNDVYFLEKIMKYIIENNNHLQCIRKNARNTYIDLFSLDRLGASFKNILEEVIDE